MVEMTFNDDERNTLFSFFKYWFESISNKGITAPLSKCVKLISINRLNSLTEVVGAGIYWVFPTGDLAWEGNSESSASEYTVRFVIAGEVEWKDTSSTADWKSALQAGYGFLSNSGGGIASKLFR
jgi:hypothetical protein